MSPVNNIYNLTKISNKDKSKDKFTKIKSKDKSKSNKKEKSYDK